MDNTAALREKINRTRDTNDKLPIMYELAEIFWQTDRNQMLEILLKAVELARSTRNMPMLLQGIWQTGVCYRALLKGDLALQYLNEALELSKKLGNRSKQGYILNSIGAYYQNISDFTTALDFFKESLEIAYELDEPERKGIGMSNIGVIRHNLGDFSGALENFLKAKKQYEDATGSCPAAILKRIGGVAMEAGDVEMAIRYFLQALRKLAPKDNFREKGNLLTDIATAQAERGEYEKALENYTEAIELSKYAGDIYQRIILLCMAASLYFTGKNFDKGWSLIRDARQHLAESHSSYLEALVFHFECVGYIAEGNYSDALKAANSCLDLAREIGNAKLLCSVLNLLSEITEKQGNFMLAAGHLEKSMQLAEEKSYKGIEYYAASESLCRVYEAMGDLRKAVIAFKRLYEVKKEQAKMQSEFIM